MKETAPMTNLEQSRELRSIEAAAPAAATDTMRELRREIATTLAAIPWPVRRDVAGRLRPVFAENVEQLARGKLAVAAEAEIARFALTQAAQHQVALVQHLRNHSVMRKLVTITLSGMTSALFEIEGQHLRNVDEIADAQRDETRARLAQGRIDAAMAERRLARIDRATERLDEVVAAEIDRLIESFQAQLRSALAQVSRPF